MKTYAMMPWYTGCSSATGTDSGYTHTDMVTPFQHKFWKTTSGGTAVFAPYTGASYSTDCIGILITSPNGLGMDGTLTVRLYSAGPTLQATISVPRYSAAGLSDRRVIFFENETWKNTINRTEIDFPANSEVSFVGTIYTAKENENENGSFRDLSNYLNSAWSVQINAVGKLGDNGAGFFYSESENLMSTKTFKGSIGPLEETVFKWKNFFLRAVPDSEYAPCVLIVPHVCQHDDSAYLQRLMTSSMVFGYLKGNYVATYAGKNDDDSSFLFTIPIEVDESV